MTTPNEATKDENPADFASLGYIAAGWPTAKLMISLTWAGALLLSGGALLPCDRRFAPRG